jgi:transposase
MKTRFKHCERKQMLLLPPSIMDWLPEEHLVHFIIDVVEQLDLSDIYLSYDSSSGQPPYDPTMMTSLLLYAYCVGVPSSRQIEKRTYEDVAFRMITANRHPDHDSICSFRKRHLQALAALFVRVLELCQEAGLVRLGHVALDGTKVRANASKHKAMSYGRMKKAKEELEQEIDKLLELAETVDAQEDARYGKGQKGWDLPKELRRREDRLNKIKEAMAALEAEAQQKAQEATKQGKTPKGVGKGDGAPPVEPAEKTQRNFTDPDSRIMKDGATKSFAQCYNGQAAVDAAEQIIVAATLTQQSNDVGQVEAMLDIMETNLDGFAPGMAVTLDAGYFSEDNVMLLEDAGLDVFMATGKVKHGEVLPPVRGRPPANLTTKQRMLRKLHTKRGKGIYAQRKATVEPVFGQMKHVRGLRQFLLRGIESVAAEWQLWCLTHNLLKLYRYGAPLSR